MGGDFNTYINIALDKEGGKREITETLYSQKYQNYWMNLTCVTFGE